MDNTTSQTNKHDATDPELVEEYRCTRSEEALSGLFARYKKPFYAYFNRMLDNDTMSADDLFQELWLKISAKLPDCRKQEKFSSWAFAIAHNLVMEHFRSVKRRNKIGSHTSDGNLPEKAVLQEDAYKEEHMRYRMQELEKAIAKLPPEQKEIVELRRKGISFNDISEIQKCPLNTALSRMHKAVKFLRSELKDAE